MTYFDDLISAQELVALLPKAIPHGPEKAPSLLIFDVSYDLSDEHWGRLQYDQEHIAHAHFADLGHDLSAHQPHLAINGGRHPLPSREHFAKWLGGFQIQASTHVVDYDRNQNNFCGRLWWMLKWCGHAHVAVLDGALDHWRLLGGDVQASAPNGIDKKRDSPQTPYPLSASRLELKTMAEVFKDLKTGQQTLIDARGKPRFLGLQEPLDPIAGHIPGALNRPFNENFTREGLFKSKALLREEFLTLLNGRDPSSVVHQCGSGVSAVPNVLAMHLAGLGATSLYAGSWSEWSRTPGMPSIQHDPST
jgi:thiosulfate/3-mercaptopyruvate sulfurtransferase